QAKEPEPAADKGGVSFGGCAWVWFPDGNPAQAAPPGTRYFRGSCAVPAGRKVKQAHFVGTCDNAFTLYVNGKEAGRSSDDPEGWREPTKIDVTKLMAEGANVLAIAALNMTDKPSPAGLIGKCEIVFDDGTRMASAINSTEWKAADKEQPNWNQPKFDDKAWPAAKSLGNYGCAPWGNFAAPGQRRGGAMASPVVSDPFCGHCDLPADVDLAKSRVFLEMDEVAPEPAAHVAVNGKYAGGFIDKPFRLEVGKFLKAGTNTVRIEPFAPKSAKLTVYPGR
ncbi:MAG: hypothetical protein NTW87_35030, partial [Planctomycetota bacterium]|nr:hypothetical protein [Planctomycetota bacterium]